MKLGSGLQPASQGTGSGLQLGGGFPQTAGGGLGGLQQGIGGAGLQVGGLQQGGGGGGLQLGGLQQDGAGGGLQLGLQKTSQATGLQLGGLSQGGGLQLGKHSHPGVVSQSGGIGLSTGGGLQLGTAANTGGGGIQLGTQAAVKPLGQGMGYVQVLTCIMHCLLCRYQLTVGSTTVYWLATRWSKADHHSWWWLTIGTKSKPVVRHPTRSTQITTHQWWASIRTATQHSTTRNWFTTRESFDTSKYWSTVGQYFRRTHT